MTRTWRTAAAAAMAILAAAGCAKTVRPTPSSAVAEALARAAAGREARCPEVADRTELEATFPFREAELTENGQERLSLAARLLACRSDAVVRLSVVPEPHYRSADQETALLAQRLARGEAYLRQAGADMSRVVRAEAAGEPAGAVIDVRLRSRGW